METSTLADRVRADAAYARFAEAVTCRRRGDDGFLGMGKALADIADREDWVALGYASFGECLAAPELGVKRTRAYKAMAVHRLFVRELAIAQRRLLEIGIEKLDCIRRVCREEPAPESIEEWLTRAATLTVRDLRAEIRRLTGKEPIDTEEELAAQERALAEALVGTLRGGTIREVRWSRFRGLELMVDTTQGPRELHVWAPDGTSAKLVTPDTQRLAAFSRDAVDDLRATAEAAIDAALSQPRTAPDPR